MASDFQSGNDLNPDYKGISTPSPSRTRTHTRTHAHDYCGGSPAPEPPRLPLVAATASRAAALPLVACPRSPRARRPLPLVAGCLLPLVVRLVSLHFVGARALSLSSRAFTLGIDYIGGSPAPEPPRATALSVPLRPRLRPRPYVLRNDALRAVAFSFPASALVLRAPR